MIVIQMIAFGKNIAQHFIRHVRILNDGAAACPRRASPAPSDRSRICSESRGWSSQGERRYRHPGVTAPIHVASLELGSQIFEQPGHVAVVSRVGYGSGRL